MVFRDVFVLTFFEPLYAKSYYANLSSWGTQNKRSRIVVTAIFLLNFFHSDWIAEATPAMAAYKGQKVQKIMVQPIVSF